MWYNMRKGPKIILVQRSRRSGHDLREYVGHGVEHILLDSFLQGTRKINE